MNIKLLQYIFTFLEHKTRFYIVTNQTLKKENLDTGKKPRRSYQYQYNTEWIWHKGHVESLRMRTKPVFIERWQTVKWYMQCKWSIG